MSNKRSTKDEFVGLYQMSFNVFWHNVGQM